MEMETRTLKIALVPVGEAIFHERTVTVEIEDEAGGEFVVLRQEVGDYERKFSIDPDEWPRLRDAIDQVIAWCR